MNDRGVTVLLGFILLMMISITFLSVVQTYYVPSILKDRELKHNDEILSSLIDLTSALTKERPNVIELNLGVEYPKYLFLMTPSTGSGSISAENFNISLEYNETYPEQRYNSTKFQTQRILVTLNYYVNPRTIFIYENTAIFKKPGNITVAEQSVFQRGRITLILINSSIGSLSANYPLDLAVVPVSYGGEVLAKNVTIEFESVNPQYWESLENRGYTVKVDGKKVRIEAENVTLSINYVYITAGLGVSIEQAQEIYASNLKPSRIVKVTYPQLKEISVSEGQSVTLGVKVLDQFNNPLRGVYVTSNKGSGYTDSKGEFYVTFTALSDEVVTFSINGLSVTYNISVVSGGGVSLFDVYWIEGSDIVWNVSEEGSIKTLHFKVEYNGEPVPNVPVHFFTTNLNVMNILNSETYTNLSGIATLKLNALTNGEVGVIGIAMNNAAIINITIEGVGPKNMAVLFSTEDAYVWKKMPYNNYGNDVILMVGKEKGSKGEAQTYIRFNLSVIPTENIINATLKLYCFDLGSAAKNGKFSVHKVTENWDESTINWNNKPDFEAIATDTVKISDSGNWVEWNVTEDVISMKSGNNYGWCIKYEKNVKDFAQFYSSEYNNPDVRPQLVVYYSLS